MVKSRKQAKTTKKKRTASAKKKPSRTARQATTIHGSEPNVEKGVDEKGVLKAFGQFLKRLRRAEEPKLQVGAKTRSQDEVVEECKAIGTPISKSTLSLYEQGKVQNPRPQILRSLADMYNVSYDDVVRHWTQARFYAGAGTAEMMAHVGRNSFMMVGSDGEVDVITLDELKARQTSLTAQAEVFVAATDFLDDDQFYDMVVGNLRRRIRYSYFMPDKRAFDNFMRRIEQDDNTLFKEIKKEGRTRFFERSNHDFPVNYVIHSDFRDGRNTQEGFVGILHGDRPQFYQLTDEKMTAKLCLSFFTIANRRKVNDV